MADDARPGRPAWSPSGARLVLYLRAHLLGAGVGLRVAETLAADPWTEGALDHLPGELREEIDATRSCVEVLRGRREFWYLPYLGATALGGTVARALRVSRPPLGRLAALEAMRSMVLAKQAMWELGEHGALPADPLPDGMETLFAVLADRARLQVALLQDLHGRAAREAFAPAGTRSRAVRSR